VNCPSQETEVTSTTTRPVENVITTKGLQDRNNLLLDGRTVENNGKLILTVLNVILHELSIYYFLLVFKVKHSFQGRVWARVSFFVFNYPYLWIARPCARTRLRLLSCTIPYRLWGWQWLSSVPIQVNSMELLTSSLVLIYCNSKGFWQWCSISNTHSLH